MAHCYVVLWIPTVYHIPIPFDEPLHGGTRTENLSDIPDEEFPVRIKAEGRDIIISVSSTEDPEQFEDFLKLCYEDFSHNGMVKYSFDSKFLDDSEFGFDDNNFPEAVYHMIKSLYHIHEFHEEESDSSLKPYLSTDDIDIHKENNAALRHYLRNHERAVLDLVKNAKTLLRSMFEMEMEKGVPEKIQVYESFPSMYVMALGYDTYIHSLYDSIYNNECSIHYKDKSLRRRAFNIENSVRYFNVLYAFFDTKIIRKVNNLSILKKAEANLKNSEISLKQLEKSLRTAEQSLSVSQASLTTSQNTLKTANYNIEETQKAAKSSTKWAIGSILFSLFIGVISILYSIHLSNESSEQLEEVKSELLNTLGNLEKYKTADTPDTLKSKSKPAVKSLPDKKTEVKSDSAENYKNNK